MSHQKLLFICLLVLSLALSACRSGTPTAEVAPTAAPTSAVVTVMAPSATAPLPPTETAAPGAATAADAATVTAQATAGGAGLTPTAAVTATAHVLGTAGVGDRAEFVADVTVPDGTDFTPGASFVKTWQVRNVGTTTWTREYALVYIRGEQMSGPAAVPLSTTVAPGQAIEISVDMIAPQAVGNYIGFWQLRTAAGTFFGVGPDANEPLYVQIDVTPIGAGTPQAGSTAAAGSLRVTAVNLSLDEADKTGACPQTFQVSASFTSEGAGTVTYRLEAAADTPTFTFELPEALEATFNNAGPRTSSVAYNLEFSDTVSGQIWLRVLTPNDLSSSRVSFSLTCQAAR